MVAGSTLGGSIGDRLGGLVEAHGVGVISSSTKEKVSLNCGQPVATTRKKTSPASAMEREGPESL